MDCLGELRRRGLIHDTTDEAALTELLGKERVTVYAGFDPTADTLHVGNLVPLMGLARFQRMGHRPIALAGGVTGLVGDPSGKSEERNLLTAEQMAYNVARIKEQLAMLLDFDEGPAQALLLDNGEWLSRYRMVDFLRDIGKHFTVNYMTAKDSVKSRLSRESGISYTEFSYMLLQATDFLHLYRDHGCRLQVGGSDQWGNITAGIELTRRVTGAQVYGVTFPLITTASGAKFGKTEKGAVYLAADRTSVYEFYQYFVRTDDRDVVSYLFTFTHLEVERVDELAKAVEEAPHRREAQKALAWEVTKLIHGEEGARSALAASQLLFGGSVDDLREEDLMAARADLPASEVGEPFGGQPRNLVDLLETSQMVPSRGQAKRLIRSGAVYINNRRWREEDGDVGPDQLLFGRHLLLRTGKKSYHLLTFEP